MGLGKYWGQGWGQDEVNKGREVKFHEVKLISQMSNNTCCISEMSEYTII